MPKSNKLTLALAAIVKMSILQTMGFYEAQIDPFLLVELNICIVNEII